jgi:archaellum biogenesis ATPase FlaH
MENIKVLYVDDNTDPYISQYLYDEYEYEGVIIEYRQRQFEAEDTYESLLSDKEVHSADIIIIDSLLFENANLSNQKLTGEEFEIILRKVFPFKEVIVVTQNDVDEECRVIKKFDTSSGDSSKHYFETEWKPLLDKAIERVKLCRKLLKRIDEKDYLERYFFEAIQQSLQGESGYDILTVADVDRLIASFEEIKREYDNK